MQFEIANDVCLAKSDYSVSKKFSAYVTFEYTEAMAAILKLYPNVGPITRFIQNSDIKLDKQAVLLERSNEPDDVIFENVSVPWYSRTFRLILTTCLTIIILGISYAMIYEVYFVAKQVRIIIRNDVPYVY